MKRRPWLGSDLVMLRQLHADGLTTHEIADKLGRGYDAVKDKCQHLGLRFTRGRPSLMTAIPFRDALPSRMFKRKPRVGEWAPRDIARLHALHAAGKHSADVALDLKRAETAVRAKASALGLRWGRRDRVSIRAAPIPPAIQRTKTWPRNIPCMNRDCRRLFKSQGPHNRLCTACRHLSITPFETSHLVMR